MVRCQQLRSGHDSARRAIRTRHSRKQNLAGRNSAAHEEDRTCEGSSNMRILLVGPASSVHIQRWYRSLRERGHDVVLATQHPPTDPSVVQGDIHMLPFRGTAGYWLNAPSLRRLVRTMRPDVLNVHYASGYGLTAAIVRHRPTLLSVWGSDVFEFPYQSWFKGKLLRWNLRRADAIASTSEAMARQVQRLVPEREDRIHVTPFGVDTTAFAPLPRHSSGSEITVGTVKSLADTYGIDTLIRAFALLRADQELVRSGFSDRLRLLIVGEGPSRAALERLACDLDVSDVTNFAGAVPHSQVPEWLNRLDVYVAASRMESFGVAVIEASACCVPVVVSDAGGLPEVVEQGRSGYVVEKDRPDLVAERLKRLVVDGELRRSLGAAGRRFVIDRYEWQKCVDRMLSCYSAVAYATKP